MSTVRFERQFPEPLRFWIVHAPTRWPGPHEWWLDLAREELIDGTVAPQEAAAATPTQGDLAALEDVTYLPPVGPLSKWWRQELRGRLAEISSDPVVQFVPGEEIEAGGGVPVLDLTPALLPVRLRRFEEVPAGVMCCWPLIPGLTSDAEICRKGLESLARAGVSGVHPLVPSLSAGVRRKLGGLTNRSGYRDLFHGAQPDVRSFARVAHEFGLASIVDRPPCGRSGRSLSNRRIAARLHLIGELTFRTGGSLDESLNFYRAARWADGETLDIEDLARSGNLGLVQQVSADCEEEIRYLVAGEASSRLGRLEKEYRGGPQELGRR